MAVGANIKKRRYELGMSQQELADAMGYKTRSTIAKIESGENDVSQKKLARLAEVLDTTPEALITGYLPTDKVVAVTSGSGKKNVVIILAGGRSVRNHQNIPNQFITVHGKPIIVYCMEVYEAHPAIDDIYVVCLKGWEDIVKAYAEQYGITKLRGLVAGGISGISSLKNAIDEIKDKYSKDDLVIIQEATRPMVPTETVSRLLQTAKDTGSATLCHSMKDYVQFNLTDGKATYVDRNNTIALQSPEAHRLEIISEVFEVARKKQHPLTETCCTMLLYNLGYHINFIESPVNNIKIVRKEDIATFGALIKE